jgi:hypothetical protein
MWIRLIAGIVLIALGALWIAQGTGAAQGSAMSGHPAYAGLGAVVAIAGVFLLFTAWRTSRVKK